MDGARPVAGPGRPIGIVQPCLQLFAPARRRHFLVRLGRRRGGQKLPVTGIKPHRQHDDKHDDQTDENCVGERAELDRNMHVGKRRRTLLLRVIGFGLRQITLIARPIEDPGHLRAYGGRVGRRRRGNGWVP